MPDHELIEKLLTVVQSPVWTRIDFWVFLVLSILGIIASVVGVVVSNRARKEAKGAKKAAKQAANSVKFFTDTADLDEIRESMSRLPQNINYHKACQLWRKANGRIRRIVVPLRKDKTLADTVQSVFPKISFPFSPNFSGVASQAR
jgi:type II secretory pathway pseudopilin PulG